MYWVSEESRGKSRQYNGSVFIEKPKTRSERRQSPGKSGRPHVPYTDFVRSQDDEIPPSGQNSLTGEPFLETEDLEHKLLRAVQEIKRPHQQRTPRERPRHHSAPHREKRGVNLLLPRGAFGEEASYEIDQIRRENIWLAKENHRLSSMVSELDSDNEHLQVLLDKQESQIRMMQEQNLNLIEANRGFMQAEDDEIIRGKIQSAMRSLRSWAASYAIPHRRSIKQNDEEMTRELFRSNVIARKFIMLDEIFSPQYDTVAPGVILNALLTKYVTDWVVKRPFFGLGGASTSRGDSANEAAQVSQAFHSVYQRAQLHGKIRSASMKSDWTELEGDAGVAHAWRSQTLRMIDPHEPGSESKVGYRHESTERKENYYQDMARIFDSVNVRVFYRLSDDHQRRKELYEIIRALGELSSSLWKQKVNIVCWGLDRFQDEPFTVASDLMIAHPAYRLDEGDSRLDGLPVQMVVQPAILAYGNEEGKNYDHYKVWAKAVVWCGSPREGGS